MKGEGQVFCTSVLIEGNSSKDSLWLKKPTEEFRAHSSVSTENKSKDKHLDDVLDKSDAMLLPNPALSFFSEKLAKFVFGISQKADELVKKQDSKVFLTKFGESSLEHDDEEDLAARVALISTGDALYDSTISRTLLEVKTEETGAKTKVSKTNKKVALPKVDSLYDRCVAEGAQAFPHVKSKSLITASTMSTDDANDVHVSKDFIVFMVAPRGTISPQESKETADSFIGSRKKDGLFLKDKRVNGVMFYIVPTVALSMHYESEFESSAIDDGFCDEPDTGNFPPFAQERLFLLSHDIYLFCHSCVLVQTRKSWINNFVSILGARSPLYSSNKAVSSGDISENKGFLKLENFKLRCAFGGCSKTKTPYKVANTLYSIVRFETPSNKRFYPSFLALIFKNELDSSFVMDAQGFRLSTTYPWDVTNYRFLIDHEACFPQFTAQASASKRDLQLSILGSGKRLQSNLNAFVVQMQSFELNPSHLVGNRCFEAFRTVATSEQAKAKDALDNFLISLQEQFQYPDDFCKPIKEFVSSLVTKTLPSTSAKFLQHFSSRKTPLIIYDYHVDSKSGIYIRMFIIPVRLGMIQWFEGGEISSNGNDFSGVFCATGMNQHEQMRDLACSFAARFDALAIMEKSQNSKKDTRLLSLHVPIMEFVKNIETPLIEFASHLGAETKKFPFGQKGLQSYGIVEAFVLNHDVSGGAAEVVRESENVLATLIHIVPEQTKGIKVSSNTDHFQFKKFINKSIIEALKEIVIFESRNKPARCFATFTLKDPKSVQMC